MGEGEFEWMSEKLNGFVNSEVVRLKSECCKSEA